MNFREILSFAIAEALSSPKIDVALRQRAKFEGWLKVETASLIEVSSGSVKVNLEYQYPSTDASGKGYERKYFADLQLLSEDGNQCLVMLKTVNTNFRYESVREASRPVTKNFEAVQNDILKLAAAKLPSDTVRYSIFAVFPVARNVESRDKQLERYLTRVLAVGSQVVQTGFVESASEWGVAWFIAKPVGFVG